MIPHQPVAAVSPGAAFLSPVTEIPTPSPFSFSVASTRWSSHRPYDHIFGLALRAMMMVFAFGSSLALATTMSSNTQQQHKQGFNNIEREDKQGFQDYPELVYTFVITSLTLIYSAYQLFKGIFDIAARGNLLSDKTSDYTTFFLDQLAGYLLVSCISVTVVTVNQQALADNTSLKKAAITSLCLSVAALLMTATCAILSGYKLSKRIMW